MDGRTAAAVLGITQGATRDEIRRAFRARAKIVHPDARGSDEAFVTLRAAADLLLAAAPARPAPRGTPWRRGPAPVDATGPVVTIASGSPASASATIGVAAGRQADQSAAGWIRHPVSRPGAAIDLTDRPVAFRRRPMASPAVQEASAAAFSRVLDTELARRCC